MNDVSDKPQDDHPDSSQPEMEPQDQAAQRRSWWERRQGKIRDEIDRNRRGDYVVPTWVLVLILVALVGGWAALIILA